MKRCQEDGVARAGWTRGRSGSSHTTQQDGRRRLRGSGRRVALQSMPDAAREVLGGGLWPLPPSLVDSKDASHLLMASRAQCHRRRGGDRAE